MAESAQDRHLPASQRKIQKAREDGQVARSRDLGHFAAVAGGGALLVALAPAFTGWLRELITRFMRAYASAEHRHRVLTEDVKFLSERERDAVLAAQRRVVAAFADAIGALRPDLRGSHLAKPLAMLLFGMINWMFTWLRPDGPIAPAQMAPIVADLFLGGLGAVNAPRAGGPSVKARSRFVDRSVDNAT